MVAGTQAGSSSKPELLYLRCRRGESDSEPVWWLVATGRVPGSYGTVEGFWPGGPVRVAPLFALVLATGPTSVSADPGEESAPLAFSLGIKAGLIPPVLAAPELVVHGPHFLIGAFGIHGGAGRSTIGGELGLELSARYRF